MAAMMRKIFQESLPSSSAPAPAPARAPRGLATTAAPAPTATTAERLSLAAAAAAMPNYAGHTRASTTRLVSQHAPSMRSPAQRPARAPLCRRRRAASLTRLSDAASSLFPSRWVAPPRLPAGALLRLQRQRFGWRSCVKPQPALRAPTALSSALLDLSQAAPAARAHLPQHADSWTR